MLARRLRQALFPDFVEIGADGDQLGAASSAGSIQDESAVWTRADELGGVVAFLFLAVFETHYGETLVTDGVRDEFPTGAGEDHRCAPSCASFVWSWGRQFAPLVTCVDPGRFRTRRDDVFVPLTGLPRRTCLRRSISAAR